MKLTREWSQDDNHRDGLCDKLWQRLQAPYVVIGMHDDNEQRGSQQQPVAYKFISLQFRVGRINTDRCDNKRQKHRDPTQAWHRLLMQPPAFYRGTIQPANFTRKSDHAESA